MATALWNRATLTALFIVAFTTLPLYAQYSALDHDFSPEIDGPVDIMAQQPDGKILIAGRFTQINGVPRLKIARLLRNLEVDLSFEITNPVLSNRVYQLWIANGKIFVQQSPDAGVARFDLNGTLEVWYRLGAYVVVDSRNGLVYGRETEVRRWERLGRWNEDGTPDYGFDRTIDACCHNTGVKALALQQDGGKEKIIIGGSFSQVDTNLCRGLARLNSDGSFDGTFKAAAPGAVNQIAVLADGRFYAVTRHSIARYFADGTRDTSFQNFEPAEFSRIRVANDGKVYGWLLDCWPCTGLFKRYTTNGAVDSSFVCRTDAAATSIAFPDDGSIVIGGEFTNVNCFRKPFLARLIPSAAPDPLDCYPPPPEPEPPLILTYMGRRKMICSWPTNYSEYILQGARRLRPNHPEREKWRSVTNVPVCLDSGWCVVTNRIARWGKYYRIVKPEPAGPE